MKSSKVIGMSSYSAQLTKELTDYWVGNQSVRLIAYARETIRKIGDRIVGSGVLKDRTGNLLNSLCWGVTYKNQLINSGFYRDEIIHSGEGILKDGRSFLHERWGNQDLNILYEVHGRQLAQEYIERYGKNGAPNGWKVFFAILAPYWGYWEKGFVLKNYRRASRYDEEDVSSFQTRFMQFSVMTEFYDQIRNDLKPARTRFRVSVAKYTRKGVMKRYRRDEEGKIKDYSKWANPNIK